MLAKITSDEIIKKPPEELLHEVWPELEKQGCDLYVLLAHASIEESMQLARKVPHFKVVVTAGGAGEPTFEAEKIAGTNAVLAVQVAVDPASGKVRVERVVCAQDMGIVVNPDGATMQVEGCVTMGLGYVFSEELRFKGGQILDKNFDSYKLPLFSWVPKIETVLVKNDELAPQGGGEPAIVPMGAVIANAVFDACGARLERTRPGHHGSAARS